MTHLLHPSLLSNISIYVDMDNDISGMGGRGLAIERGVQDLVIAQKNTVY